MRDLIVWVQERQRGGSKGVLKEDTLGAASQLVEKSTWHTYPGDTSSYGHPRAEGKVEPFGMHARVFRAVSLAHRASAQEFIISPHRPSVFNLAF